MRKKRRIGTLFVILVLALGSIFWSLENFQNGLSSGQSTTASGEDPVLTFLDIGQGDATLLRWNGHALLIDAGDVATAETMAVRLVNLGVRKLDMVIATHAHADHIGGMARLLEIFPVNTVYWSAAPGEGRLYENLAGAFSDREMIPLVPEPKTVWTLDGVTVRFLGPVKSYEELNDSSLVCRIEVNGVTVLMTGDMQAEAEADLLQSHQSLSAQVLKVGHHGSKTSSTEPFLQAVAPELAVISCGKENSYGLPAQEILDRMKAGNISVLRTDLEGELDFALKEGKLNRLQPESQEAAYIGNTKSYKFHRPGCSGLPEEQNRVEFWTRENAAFAGYSPCGSCKP